MASVIAKSEIPALDVYTEINNNSSSAGLQDEYSSFPSQKKLILGGHTRASSSALSTPDPCNGIAVDCFYEIVHSELPPIPPTHIKDIRAVLVSEKTNNNVIVRFPSVKSLRVYFQEEIGSMSEHPKLDEQIVMRNNLAVKVLGRRIPLTEFESRKRLKSFWVLSNALIANPGSGVPLPEQQSRGLSAGKTCIGMMKWGMRRKARYTNRHRGKLLSLVPFGETGSSGGHEKRVVKRKAEIGDNGRNKKKGRFENGKISFINSRDRWSKERYEAAETKLMEIMRENGAAIGRTILRPDLRNEARKHIGDTGLLDHLLKHMAGKVDKEKGDRLCRRHNSDGAMEYWLEPAELADLRKQAGVKDPAWVPPPGWKPGDSPYCDPESARQLNELKEEIGHMKWSMLMLLPAARHEEEGDSTPDTVKTSQIDLESSQEESYKSLLVRQTLLEQKFHEILATLRAVQEEVRRRQKGDETAETAEKSASAPLPPPPPAASAAGAQKQQAWPSVNQTYSRVRKSDFRICKPQGTFLWPAMGTSSSQAAMPLEDLFLVPTPTPTPTSTSSALLALPPPSPSSPVKPIPRKTPSSRPPPLADYHPGSPFLHHHHHQGLSAVKSEQVMETTGRSECGGSCIMDVDHLSSPGTWLALATPCPLAVEGLPKLQAL